MSQPQRLKSCPYDLHIVVGSGEEGIDGNDASEKTFYHYHQVLASWSHYIDVMLSAMPIVPGQSASSSSSHRTLRFPDISPDTWQKMMRILQPGGCRNLTLEDIVQVLPFYGQYTFQSGMDICDEFLAEQLDTALDRSDAVVLRKSIDMYPLLIRASVLCHELKLPKSMFKAQEFASRAFKGEYSTIEKYDGLLRSAVSVILDDEATRDYILNTILQKHVRTVEDMKGLLTEDESSIILTYMERFRQISALEEILSHIHAPTLCVTNAGCEMVNGYYAEKMWEGFRSSTTNDSSSNPPNRPGVMAQSWVHLLRVKNEEILYKGKQRPVDRIVIQASDPFGKKWQLIAAVKQDDAQTCVPVILYTWEQSDGVNSLLPPKTGWSTWSTESTGAAPAPVVEYTISGQVYA